MQKKEFQLAEEIITYLLNELKLSEEKKIVTYRLNVYLVASGVSRDSGEHRSGQFASDQDALDSFRREASEFRQQWKHRYDVISFTVYKDGQGMIAVI
ncbi:MAG: hypothetical protein COU26_03800 [Candidatus Levybacteria bacterium CG10_big_fil_rev_8_21_14_0_10_36_30]|nr:MAG: hypothetical protein COU26_03800 [Candidatus Levybacteria bacterium CG10_big_fil_rev_8_21_14_0_10_36_30]